MHAQKNLKAATGSKESIAGQNIDKIFVQIIILQFKNR